MGRSSGIQWPPPECCVRVPCGPPVVSPSTRRSSTAVPCHAASASARAMMRDNPAGRHRPLTGFIVLLVSTLFARGAAAQTDKQIWGELTLDWIKSHTFTLGGDVEPKVLVARSASTTSCGHVRKSAVTSPSSPGSGHSSAIAWGSHQTSSTSWTLSWIGFLQTRDPGTIAMRLRRSASRLTSLCRFISLLRRLALRFRRLSSDSASGPNRWRRSGGAFMWLRTRPISRVMTDS